MIDTLLTEVDDIVDREYHRANKDHLAFASDHEGHDVLQEEIEEAKEELEKLEKASDAMKVAIRQNDEKAVRNIAKSAYYIACNLAAEATQVAAMALKIVSSQELRQSNKYTPQSGLE